MMLFALILSADTAKLDTSIAEVKAASASFYACAQPYISDHFRDRLEPAAIAGSALKACQQDFDTLDAKAALLDHIINPQYSKSRVASSREERRRSLIDAMAKGVVALRQNS